MRSSGPRRSRRERRLVTVKNSISVLYRVLSIYVYNDKFSRRNNRDISRNRYFEKIKMALSESRVLSRFLRSHIIIQFEHFFFNHLDLIDLKFLTFMYIYMHEIF